MTDAPALELRDISRIYRSGDSEIRALDGISLRVMASEFVAVMGQSGSGKSTLMNIVGCLDTPNSGSYRIFGREAGSLERDALADLRRETFGFIFQRYNLLATETAAGNVEIPAIYAGKSRDERQKRSRALLDRLGMGGRTGHRPSELSGGQQQRVAIARALMNNPPIILADEPTGALDSKSGQEVMTLLHELHAEGRTILLITHDEKVAAHAQRVIHFLDGKIHKETIPASSSRGSGSNSAPSEILTSLQPEERFLPSPCGRGAGGGGAEIAPLSTPPHPNHSGSSLFHREPPLVPQGGRERSHGITTGDSVREAIHMALTSLRVNKFRTALTLLGIVIGVAAVVAMLAVGSGSKQKVLNQISAMGTNLLLVRPGAPGIRSADIVTLVPDDATAIGRLDNIEAAMPERSARMTVRFGSTDYQTSVQGTGTMFPATRDWQVARGQFFDERDTVSYAPVAVLGQTVANTLFPRGVEAVGQFILVKNVPFQVIGIMSRKGANAMGTDQDDVVFVPFSTGLVRLFGKTYVNTITVKVEDVKQIDDTQDAITDLLKSRHKTEDFQIRNMASILETATETQNTFTLLLGTVAAISLIVGGIGVMNIMLVSVTERTREIGIRVATGARTRDILLQFNIEAIVVCAVGGVMGVVTGLLIGLTLRASGMQVIFSPFPPILAFACAFTTGVVFGYLPARKAAALDPVVALASE